MRCDCDESTGPREHRGRRVKCAACGYKSHAWHATIIKVGESYYASISEAKGFEPDPGALDECEWNWPQGRRGGEVRVTRCCLAPAARS